MTGKGGYHGVGGGGGVWQPCIIYALSFRRLLDPEVSMGCFRFGVSYLQQTSSLQVRPGTTRYAAWQRRGDTAALGERRFGIARTAHSVRETQPQNHPHSPCL